MSVSVTSPSLRAPNHSLGITSNRKLTVIPAHSPSVSLTDGRESKPLPAREVVLDHARINKERIRLRAAKHVGLHKLLQARFSLKRENLLVLSRLGGWGRGEVESELVANIAVVEDNLEWSGAAELNVDGAIDHGEELVVDQGVVTWGCQSVAIDMRCFELKWLCLT